MDLARTHDERRVKPHDVSFAFLLAYIGVLLTLRWQSDGIDPRAWIFCIAISLSTFVLIALGYQRYNDRLIAYSTIAFAAIIGGITAMIIASITAHITDAQSIESFAHNHTLTIIGNIVDEPDIRPMHTKYTVEAERILIGSGSYDVHGRLLVSDFSGYPIHEYGDMIRVTGTLEKPGMVEEFSYENYLSINDIRAVIYRAKVQKINESGFWFYGMLYAQKQRFEARINRLFPEPHASFLAGLLTGSRKGIPDHILEKFQIAGLTHIIAISGYNITIVLTILGSVFIWVPFRFRIIPLSIGIIIFTIFVGSSSSVVRAALMGILGLTAITLNRKADMRLLILWSAFFMTALNPRLLWFDVGFQLSFLAVIGLTELSNPIETRLLFLPEWMRVSLSATLAAQATTLPLMIILFDRISLIAPFTNILAAILIPPAMLFGFLAVIISVIIFPLGQLIGFACYICLQLVILIASMAAAIPYAAI